MYRWAASENYGDPPINQIGRHPRQPIILTVCPAVVDHDGSTVYIAGFI
jgi:hypothetical protein